MSLNLFKEKKINPYPGMQLNLDGQVATVRSVTGGRVIVDFNPMLAGKEIHYWIKPLKIIKDTVEKAKAVFKNVGFAAENVTFKEGTLTLKLANKEKLGRFLELLEKEVKKHIPEVKKVVFK